MNDQQQSRADALTDEHIATLKLAARAVTPQDIDGAERIESRPDGSYITCPACEGEGCIPFESDYCNYDHVAIGVQFYGVGTEPGAAEAYFRAAKPATILALLDRLERAESALAASPVSQPAAAPADERAAQNKGYFVYDPEGNGFELYATDAERAEAHNTAIKECRQEAIDDGEWPLEVESIVSGIVTHLTVATQVDGDSCDYEARAAASPAAERVTAALQALSADVHTLGDGWANDEAMIGLAKKYLRVEPKPASPELSLWRDFVLLAVTDAAPQPAQADAPAEAHCDGSGAVPVSVDDWSECPVCHGAGCQPEPRGHQWDEDGERCVKCGDKDWMAGKSCSESLVNRCAADAPVRIEALRKGLFEARDAMRVMSNWVKKSDPAGHSWAVRMMDRASAALNGEADAAQADAPAEAREPLNEVLFGNDEALEMAADALDRLGQDSAAAGVRALRMLAHKAHCAPADAGEAVAHMRVRSTDAGSTSHAIDIAPEAAALDLKPGEYLLYLAPPTTRAAYLTTTLSPDQRISMAAKLFFFANELLNGADHDR